MARLLIAASIVVALLSFTFDAAAQEPATDGDAGAPAAPVTPAAPPASTEPAPEVQPAAPAEPTPPPAPVETDPTPPSAPAVAAPPPVSADTGAHDPSHSSSGPRKNALQADLGLAVVGLAYERMLLPKLAVQLEAQVFGTWFGPMFDLPNFSGFGGQIRPTYFVTDTGPRGVYVAPFLRVNRVRAEKDYAEGFGVGFSTGVFGGYSFVFGDAFNLRVGAGAQYMSYVVDVPAGPEGRDTRLAFKQFFPALDLVVGYAF